MMLLRRFLVLSVATLVVSQAAWAGPRISLLGGVNKAIADPVTVLGATVEPSLGFQGGLEFGFNLSPMVGFDVGALYVSSRLKTTIGAPFNIETTASSGSIDIPAQFRLKLGKVFSIGAGGFYDFSLEDGGGSNYGYLGSLRITFPMGLFLDGRYLGGLKTPDGGGNKSKGWMAMLGFTFGGKK